MELGTVTVVVPFSVAEIAVKPPKITGRCVVALLQLPPELQMFLRIKSALLAELVFGSVIVTMASCLPLFVESGRRSFRTVRACGTIVAPELYGNAKQSILLDENPLGMP